MKIAVKNRSSVFGVFIYRPFRRKILGGCTRSQWNVWQDSAIETHTHF